MVTSIASDKKIKLLVLLVMIFLLISSGFAIGRKISYEEATIIYNRKMENDCFFPRNLTMPGMNYKYPIVEANNG